jgi:hemin uptake protein HemP
MSDRPQPTQPPQGPSEPMIALPRIIDAAQLFQQGREIWIDHGGVRYRLRITRRNKLILQK